MDKKSIVRWAFGLIGLAKAAIWIREMLVRPDRDVFIEMIGSVVSIHSLYLGGAIIGVGVVIVSAIPVIQWIFKWPERRRAREGAALQAEIQVEVDAFRGFSNRVRAARDRAIALLKHGEFMYDLPCGPHEVVADLAELEIRLKMLGIPTPNVRVSDDVESYIRPWAEYLLVVTPLAELGDIDKARSLTISDGKTRIDF